MTNRNIVVTFILIGYYILTAIIGILISTKTKLPDEIKRKILHAIGFISYGFFILGFDNWIYSIIVCFCLAIGSFILILILERYKPSFLLFFKERNKGEIKYTILLVYLAFISSIVISWGYLNIKEIGLLSIYVWGFSDMGASLIGRSIGKHHLKFNRQKTIEGSIGCLFISLIVTLFIVLIYFPLSFKILLFVIIISLTSTLVEAFSKHGLDTISVPTAILLVSTIIYLIAK